MTLQVGTYNVFLREPFLEGIAYDRSNPRCRATHIGTQLGNTNLDIVALQEAFTLNDLLVNAYKTATSAPQLQTLIGQPWPAPTNRPNGTRGCFNESGTFYERMINYQITNGGVSLITPHAFVGTPWTDYGQLSEPVDTQFGPTARGYCDCTSEDCLAYKGLVYAPVQINRAGHTVSLNVLSTHLNASGDPEVRRRQIRSLVAFVEQRLCTHSERRTWPIIFLGDLNVGHIGGGATNDEYYSILEELNAISCMENPRDAYLEVHQSWNDEDPDAGTSTCSGSSIQTCGKPTHISRRLDYIMILNPTINPAYPSSGQAWRIETIRTAATEALNEPSCSFEYENKVYNTAGHLSDHKLLTATLELRRGFQKNSR